MIDKIQEFVEDHVSMDITRKQIILGLCVVGALLLLIIMMLFGSGGPKEDPNYVSTPPGSEAK